MNWMQSTNLSRIDGVAEQSEEVARDFVCKATQELGISLDLDEQTKTRLMKSRSLGSTSLRTEG